MWCKCSLLIVIHFVQAVLCKCSLAIVSHFAQAFMYMGQVTNPADTPRTKNVIMTLNMLRRRFDVIMTLLLRCVPLGRSSCLVTWFCYQLTANPGNKTATFSWPDPHKFGVNVVANKDHQQCSLSLVVNSGTTDLASRLGTKWSCQCDKKGFYYNCNDKDS